MNLVNGALDLFAALVISMLLLSVYGEKREQPFEKYLTATMFVHLAALLLDACRWFLYAGREPNPTLILCLIAAATVLSLVSSACFVNCLIAYFSDRLGLTRNIFPILRVLFVLSVLVMGVFWLCSGELLLATGQTSGAALQYGWTYWLGQSLWGLVCVIGVILLVHYRKLLRRHELLELLIYCTLPVAALLLKLVWDASQIYLAMTLSLVLIHSVMYREHRRRLQEQERKLEQSRIAVLLGQIQPHFLYNVLNSIYYLCASDPLAAQRAISDFSDYLRTNLDALKQENPIDFGEELRHVRTYLALEKTRYDEMLTVSFDIRCESFRMPALCLQMLVENAVKHGIGKAKQGGTVQISSWEEPECYAVCVADNGVGFDPEETPKEGAPRVGLENIRCRLMLVSRGSLEIKSQKDRGTKATIRIPKQ